jgi:hypothetical protein
MPEEIAGTVPESAPAEVIVAAAQPEPLQETTEFQVERFTVAATFAPPSANDDAAPLTRSGTRAPRCPGSTGVPARNTTSSST